MQRDELIKKYVNRIVPKKFTYDLINTTCRNLIEDIKAAYPNSDLHFEIFYDSGIYKILAPENKCISLVLQDNDTKISIRNVKGTSILSEYILTFDGVSYTIENSNTNIVNKFSRIQDAIEMAIFTILLELPY